jgi:uncharacterized DUF497 family protein
MQFEWHEEKAESNLEKHGVDFIDAAQIFAGFVLSAPDDRADYGEERFRAIGCHDGQTYIVIYTWREEYMRIISAWKAGKHDRELYQAFLTGRTER